MGLRMAVSVTTVEGKRQEATGPYMSLGDVIAFEERFGVPFEELYIDKPDGNGGVERTRGSSYSEKRAVFFAWRTLAREGVDVGEFDTWVDALDSVRIKRSGGQELDPTAPEDPASA